MPRILAAISAIGLSLILFISVLAAPIATVGLGAAGGFAILAGAGITNTGPTTIVGDVGSHPNGAQTGFGSVTLTGTNHGNDAVTAGAKADLVTAYNDAAGRPGGTPVGALGAGETLLPGLYTDNNAPDSMAVGGLLILDGLGNPDSVFIFQSGSSLTFAANTEVRITNGTQACNVFWQVGSSATVNTGAHVEGSILALASISLLTGASIHGRALARDGAVTLDTNTITRSTCASGTNTGTPTSGTQSSTGSGSTTGTQTGTNTGSATDSGTNSNTGTLSGTESATDTGNSTSTPTTQIPVFPTWAALGVAVVAAVGGAFLLLRRRLP